MLNPKSYFTQLRGVVDLLNNLEFLLFKIPIGFPGTPYYISPEMCAGKAYDDKSDIWALGCIVYEMACLQKTFEGSNLPALVNKV